METRRGRVPGQLGEQVGGAGMGTRQVSGRGVSEWAGERAGEGWERAGERASGRVGQRIPHLYHSTSSEGPHRRDSSRGCDDEAVDLAMIGREGRLKVTRGSTDVGPRWSCDRSGGGMRGDMEVRGKWR